MASCSIKRCGSCKRYYSESEDNFYYDYKTGTYRATCKRCRWAYSAVKDSRRRAIRKGIGHNLDYMWCMDNLTENCPILGIKLISGNGNSHNSPTIDRIDNNKGYTKDNCIVISARANRIKTDATLQELLQVYAFYKARSSGDNTP